MKKIFSIILCASVVLISGCSGVSQEEYNSVLEENSKLKESSSGLESTSSKTSTSSSVESSNSSESIKTDESAIPSTDSSISDDDATNNFEIDGYNIKITGNYDFVVLDNEFSEYNGQTLFTVNAEVENVSNDLDHCFLMCTITAPDDTQLNLVDTLLGDNGIITSKIKKGETFKGCFAVPYVGDGEYSFEFIQSISKSAVYKINITKP